MKLDGGEAEWDQQTKDFIRAGLKDTAITNARTGIDGASLIFAHSVLDDCAWSYLRACAIAAPNDWDPILKDRKIAFTSMHKSTEVIREELINEKLEQLERESLLKKVDLLFQLCKPPKGFTPINNYGYEREHLEIIDNGRHAIIHRDGMGKPLPNTEEHLDYILKTALFLMAVVNKKYSIQLNTAKMINPSTAPAAAEPDAHQEP